ncbi:hypothetical protein [Candidatus Pristimantibacillus sp. PTI5]|uniref:hypothetical protein n=1 Tax=Candidatus Pristimantibacillus sp. PTI5 TaxID=3400422 RepID=UPI003B029AEC
MVKVKSRNPKGSSPLGFLCIAGMTRHQVTDNRFFPMLGYFDLRRRAASSRDLLRDVLLFTLVFLLGMLDTNAFGPINDPTILNAGCIC